MTERVQSVRFFIVPSQDSPCPGEFTGDPRLTLSQYFYNMPRGQVDVTLDLQPGIYRVDIMNHLLVTMSGFKSFVLTGTNASFICDSYSRLQSLFTFCLQLLMSRLVG